MRTEGLDFIRPTAEGDLGRPNFMAKLCELTGPVMRSSHASNATVQLAGTAKRTSSFPRLIRLLISLDASHPLNVKSALAVDL